MSQDSDSEGESADEIEVTMVTTCESETHRSLRNLNEQDYQLIMSPHGWLDGAVIHNAGSSAKFQRSSVLVNLCRYYTQDIITGCVLAQ